ncbi:MAG TPA: hypothetical protein DCQ12_05840, partial [Candidatus Cloacimonas sp.]|nr:hypothetical protein [Candidatus Cloacimonas sp.]
VQGVVVDMLIVVEWGGRFSDRLYCGALASSGYRASPALRMRIVVVGIRMVLGLFYLSTDYTNLHE